MTSHLRTLLRPFTSLDGFLHRKFDSVEMKRRVVPPALSLFIFGVAATTAFDGTFSETVWLEWSAFILVILFAFKSILFFWMRQTMIEQTRRLTIFGWALCDFFLAITIGDVFLAYTFLISWFAIYNGKPLASFTWRVFGRSGLLASCFAVLFTGIALAYEMKKASGNIRVHEEILNVRSENIDYNGG